MHFLVSAADYLYNELFFFMSSIITVIKISFQEFYLTTYSYIKFDLLYNNFFHWRSNSHIANIRIRQTINVIFMSLNNKNSIQPLVVKSFLPTRESNMHMTIQVALYCSAGIPCSANTLSCYMHKIIICGYCIDGKARKNQINHQAQLPPSTCMYTYVIRPTISKRKVKHIHNNNVSSGLCTSSRLVFSCALNSHYV